jgi:ATP-dependent helicase HrpB
LVEAGGSFRAAACVAVLSERRGPAAGDGRSTDSDLLSLVDRLDAAPLGVRQAARELEAIARRLDLRRPPVSDDTGLRRALLAGFPDRVARRREPGSARLLMASGTGAVLARESGVHDGEFVLALDVVGGPSGPASEALVRMASRVERDWLAPTRRETVRHFDPGTGSVRATERASYLGLLLMERSVPVDPQAASPLLVEALLARGLGPEADALIQRASFAGVDVDVPGLVEKACEGRTRVRAIDLEALLPRQTASTLERLAPKSLAVPSGRRVALDYRADGSVVASVKLQEVFGLKDSPRVGPGREPIVFELLAPNGRPVQKTRDLRGFWQRTYPDVRKELRGRYPRHPWPEDPWTAEPTHRTKRRR